MAAEVKDTSDKTASVSSDLVYLYSWPLVGQFPGGAPFTIKKLDFDSERANLLKTLQQSQKGVRLRMEVATTSNLLTLLTMGCRALHYTGHGMQQCLAFEDEEGKMHSLDSNSLKNICEHRRSEIKFVFVSACHSEIAGRAFVGAGVPHVIAVKHNAQVADRSSQIFTAKFYLALLVGRTVQQAFDMACMAIKTDALTKRSDEPKKFLLLPEGANHDVAIFEDLPEGRLQDLSPPPRPNNLPAWPEHFSGRNMDMQQVVAMFNKRRLITLTGEKGIGKTSLAVAVGRYLLHRSNFEALWFVPLDQPPERAIAVMIAQALGLNIANITNASLFAALRHKQYLLILDAADPMIKITSPESPRCLRSFVSDMLQACPQLKLLITCTESITGIRTATEWSKALTRLAPSDAAQLFYDLRPRDLPLSEFGAGSDPNKAAQILAQHRVMQLLRGHPGKIFETAPLLRDNTMDQLVDVVQALEEKEKVAAEAAAAAAAAATKAAELATTSNATANATLAATGTGSTGDANSGTHYSGPEDLQEAHAHAQAQAHAHAHAQAQAHSHAFGYPLSPAHARHSQVPGLHSLHQSTSHPSHLAPHAHSHAMNHGFFGPMSPHSPIGAGGSLHHLVPPGGPGSGLGLPHGPPMLVQSRSYTGGLTAAAGSGFGSAVSMPPSSPSLVQSRSHAEGVPNAMSPVHASHMGGSEGAMNISVSGPLGYPYAHVQPGLPVSKYAATLADPNARKLWAQLGDQEVVSWSQFEPVLQQHFLQLTGVTRSLGQEDLATIKRMLPHYHGYPGQVSVTAFAKFWAHWFSPFLWTMAKLKEERIWDSTSPRLLHGLLTRAESLALLRGQPVGSFLLRFSESQPGCIAVDFVDAAAEVRHTLIKPTPQGQWMIMLTDGERSYETLSELIIKCRLLTALHPGVEKSQAFSPTEDMPH